MKCVVCGDEMLPNTDEYHHREPSPQRDMCLGCWLVGIQLEMWILRKADKSTWGLKVQRAMKEFLDKLKNETAGLGIVDAEDPKT